jgi:dienelactone hydrolase
VFTRFARTLVVCVVAGLSAGACVASASPATLDRAQAESAARATVSHYRAQAAVAGPIDCVGPAGDPAPGSQAWTERDYVNQYCATERLQDEYGSPAFGTTFWAETPAIYAGQNVAMLMDPTHPHLSLGQVVPGGTTTDPYRTIDRWTAAGHGRVDAISFPAADGATLNGYLFRPPAKVKGPYPGVVITTGSIQGYQQMYFWAAEGLAEAGYMVLTYDVQGQGNSDTLPANCTPDACPGVPFQQNYNFFQGAEDALNWFFSAKNPGRTQLNTAHVGIAGHSLGASAVSVVGQCDARVRAIVAWDNLAPATGTCKDQIPDGLPAGSPAEPTLTTPALGINSEYFFNPEPMSAPPDPQSKAGAFAQLVTAGTDTMQIALRSSTHLEYTYVPYILPASKLGERVAFYYTLAWFDRYLRNKRGAFGRLVATRFDGSADAHSIGAGYYDPTKAAANPADTTAGNVPYTIKGLPVADRVSIYYDSEYSLTSPRGAHATCKDIRAGCP